MIQTADGQTLIYQPAVQVAGTDPNGLVAAAQPANAAIPQIIQLPGGATLNQGATATTQGQQLMVVPSVPGAHKLPLNGEKKCLGVIKDLWFDT